MKNGATCQPFGTWCDVLPHSSRSSHSMHGEGRFAPRLCGRENCPRLAFRCPSSNYACANSSGRSRWTKFHARKPLFKSCAEIGHIERPSAQKRGYRSSTAPGTRFHGGMLRGTGFPSRLRCSGRRIGGATRCMHSRNGSPAAATRANVMARQSRADAKHLTGAQCGRFRRMT